MKTLVFVALVAGVVGAQTAVGGEPTPVYTMSFADGVKDYKVENFQNQLSFTVKRLEGEACVFVRNEKFQEGARNDTAWTIASKKFPASAGKTFAVKVRSAGDVNMMVNYRGTRIAWFGKDGQSLRTVDTLGKDIDLVSEFGFRCRPGRWTETTTYGIVPDGAVEGRLLIGADNPDIKKDDCICLAKADYYEADAARDLVFEGDYDAPTVAEISPSKPCADFDAPIVIRLADAHAIPRASVKVVLDGRDVTGALSKSWFRDIYTYRPETPWKEGEAHQIDISAADEFGNSFTEERFVYFTKKPADHPKFSVRDDGMMLSDGKPFFPFSFFAIRPFAANGNSLENAVRELKENGFYIATSYARPGVKPIGQYERFCEVCNQQRMPFITQPDMLAHCETAEASRARNKNVLTTMIEGRRHVARFGWELGDDTASQRSPEEVRHDHLLAHAVDDGIVTTQSDISKEPGRYYEFAPYTDVFRVEVYPFRAAEPQPNEMPQIKRDLEVAYSDLQRSGAKNRSIWAIPQIFEGWKLWKRHPSYEEILCETVLSIACRARGITYYTYCSGSLLWGARVDPKHWEETCRLGRFIDSYRDDIVLRDAAVQPELTIVDGAQKDGLGQFPVTALLKENGRLFAASTAFEPVTIRFAMPDGTSFTHRFERNGVLIK